MKIKKFTVEKKSKLIYLQILKSKLYKKEFRKKKYNQIRFDKIKLYIKKIAKVIYEYHASNRKILFLNFSKLITKKINHIIYKTRHLAVENFENYSIENKIKLYKNDNLSNSFDLILMFNCNSDSLKKAFSGIPLIILDSNYFSSSFNDYKVPGNFKYIENQVNDHLFLSIIKSIFKKVKVNKLLSIKKNLRWKLIRKKYKKHKKNNFFRRKNYLKQKN